MGRRQNLTTACRITNLKMILTNLRIITDFANFCTVFWEREVVEMLLVTVILSKIKIALHSFYSFNQNFLITCSVLVVWH